VARLANALDAELVAAEARRAERSANPEEGAVHFLLDFTAVQHVAMPDQAIAERAERPALCPGFKRVVVAPHPELFGLYCVFAAKQERIGSDAPVVTSSMQSAVDFLGLRLPQFAPVESDVTPHASTTISPVQNGRTRNQMDQCSLSNVSASPRGPTINAAGRPLYG